MIPHSDGMHTITLCIYRALKILPSFILSSRYVLRSTVEHTLTPYDESKGAFLITELCTRAERGTEMEQIRREVTEAAARKKPQKVEGDKQTFEIPSVSHNTLRKRLFLKKRI